MEVEGYTTKISYSIVQNRGAKLIWRHGLDLDHGISYGLDDPQATEVTLIPIAAETAASAQFQNSQGVSMLATHCCSLSCLSLSPAADFSCQRQLKALNSAGNAKDRGSSVNLLGSRAAQRQQL